MAAVTRVAVIGSGGMGRAHLAAYSLMGAVEIRGLVSRTAVIEDAEVPVYRTLDDMLRVESVDMVSICTPTHTHAAYIRRLADAGVDIVCEKPIDLESVVAKYLFTFCQERGVRLFVAHVVRYFTEYRRISEIVRNRELGEIGTVRLRRAVPFPRGSDNWFRDDGLSGGVTFDLMIHDVDFLVELFGFPLQVYAQRADSTNAQIVLATLHFPQDVVVVLEGAWGGVSQLEYSVELSGSLGSVQLDTTPRVPLRLVTDASVDGNIRSEAPLAIDPYRAQLEDFVDLRKCIDLPGEDTQALLALQVCEAIAKSTCIGLPVGLAQDGV